MFDLRPGETEPVDFDEIADHFVEQGLEVSPSQVHGCLCGLLAAGGPTDPEWGLAALFEALDLAMYGALAEEMLRLYAISAAALEDDEFEFYPLLPDDEREIQIVQQKGACASLQARSHLRCGFGELREGSQCATHVAGVERKSFETDEAQWST